MFTSCCTAKRKYDDLLGTQQQQDKTVVVSQQNDDEKNNNNNITSESIEILLADAQLAEAKQAGKEFMLTHPNVKVWRVMESCLVEYTLAELNRISGENDQNCLLTGATLALAMQALVTVVLQSAVLHQAGITFACPKAFKKAGGSGSMKKKVKLVVCVSPKLF